MPPAERPSCPFVPSHFVYPVYDRDGSEHERIKNAYWCRSCKVFLKSSIGLWPPKEGISHDGP